MLSRFEVKGFKSLLDVKLDLGAVNVFIGANGSGKSNLLEAIGFLGTIAWGVSDFESYRYRGVRPGDPESFNCQFPNRTSPAISLKVGDPDTTYEIALIPAQEYGWLVKYETVVYRGQERSKRLGSNVWISEQDGELKLKYNSFPLNVPMPRIAHLFLPTIDTQITIESQKINGSFATSSFFDYLANYAIYTPTTPQLRGSQDDIHRDPLGLGGSGLAKAIEELAQADATMLGPFDLDDVMELIEWADEIGTNSVGRPAGMPVQLRLGDRYMGDKRNAVSALEASEGALYVLFLLALVGHKRAPRMFAVDNFDQSLHPRLARILTKMVCDEVLADGTRQMFATTHNPLVLNGLDLRDERIRLFTVDRDAAGASVIRRVEVSEKLMAKAEEGFPLSELWTMGWLGGGVPQNY